MRQQRTCRPGAQRSRRLRKKLRQRVIDWLRAQLEIKDVHPSPLTDAWYGHE